MPEAVRHVHELADRIGPRPATTDAEAEAADYIQGLFVAHGLEVERQEFESPRTYAWAYVVYHLLTIVSVGALYFADLWGPLRWVAFAVAALTAFTMWMDLDTRWGLSDWLPPMGPSQNVIAKRVPRSRRGERVRRVVVVAHYDSARSSLAFSPGMVKNFSLSFGMMKWCTFLVPVLILADNLSFLAAADPYLWYAALVVAAYLVIPLLINVHRELFMHFTDGANDNASGVAALLGIMEAITPVSEAGVSTPTQPLGRVEQHGHQHVDVPSHVQPESEDGLLRYAPARVEEEDLTSLPDDFEWAATSEEPVRGQSTMDFDVVDPAEPAMTPHVERAAEPEPPAAIQPRPASASMTGSWGDVDTDFDGDGVPDVGADIADRSASPADLDDDKREELFGSPEQQAAPREPRRGKKRFFGLGRKKERDADVSDWLGVDNGFDAREEGRKIGSWDGFDEDDDDGIGFKGGWAGDDPIGDPEFAANEASRIRRRVVEGLDRSFSDKEIWFVATGSEEVGTQGMKAFLDEYAEELRGVPIINLDNLGNGTLHWVTKEGMARRYSADRRLVSTARRVSREDEIMAKGREYKGLSTDATPALARGFKAMSVMAFDINGRLPDWHWRTDTVENIQAENIENAVRLVAGIIREL